MKILHFLLAALLSVTILSCRERQLEGHGPNSTDTRNISKPFSRIEIDAPVQARISVAQGPAAIIISGYANLLQYIKTEVRDSTLHIFVPDHVELHTDHNFEATITCPVLSGLSVSGAGTASVSGILTVSNFSAETSGAAAVMIDQLQAGNLSVDASGASSVAIASGKADNAAYDISGSSKLRAYGLGSSQATVDCSGASSAEISAGTMLTVTASGTSAVHYKGEPKVTTDVSGVATVSRADGTPAPVNRREGDSNDDDDDDDNDSARTSW